MEKLQLPASLLSISKDDRCEGHVYDEEDFTLQVLTLDGLEPPIWVVPPTPLPPALKMCIIKIPEFNLPIGAELPRGLEELVFSADCDFNQPLPELPQTLRKLRLGRHFTHPLILPAGIQEVSLPLALPYRVKVPHGAKVEWV
ncbi:hypothetical protein JKP88DRAFT_281487 [Tribonema minus]|uniref:Uncharacterized protein n=1 Tax=Tribonema minus TaxID=303371 RepID=A0A835YML1_9STRA|nr:hypothetical protein JKP88DRAFT_281487 [Tribonema minus]